jgi:hypothetical protein
MTDDTSLRLVPIDPKYPYTLSLNDLLCKRIADVGCSISFEFDGPVIDISSIHFEDGSRLDIGGEHDIAYLYAPYHHQQSEWPELTEAFLARVYNAHNQLEPDDEDYKDPEDYA